jgi:hypothetical protein
MWARFLILMFPTLVFPVVAVGGSSGISDGPWFALLCRRDILMSCHFLLIDPQHSSPFSSFTPCFVAETIDKQSNSLNLHVVDKRSPVN